MKQRRELPKYVGQRMRVVLEAPAYPTEDGLDHAFWMSVKPGHQTRISFLDDWVVSAEPVEDES